MSGSARILLVTLALLLWSVPAFAQWTVAPGQVKGAVDAHKAWLVATAGAPSDQLAPFSAALTDALKAQGATLVMDSTAIGDVAVDGDTDIVTKAKHLPVDAIAVVRVFASDVKTTGVVAMYDKSGNAIGGFAVDYGVVPVVEDTEAMPTVQPEAEKPVEEEEPPRRLKAVVPPAEDPVEIKVGVERKGFQIVLTKPDGTKVSGAKMYEALGEDELAKQFRSKRRLKVVVLLSGLGTMAAGAIYGGVTASTMSSIRAEKPDIVDVYGDCLAIENPVAAERCNVSNYNERLTDFNEDRRKRFNGARAHAYIAVGVAAVGLAGTIVGIVLPSHPLSLDELQQRALKLDGRAGVKVDVSVAGLRVRW